MSILEQRLSEAIRELEKRGTLEGSEAREMVCARAEEILQQCCGADSASFPVPVREIAERLHLRVFETKMADAEVMEFNELGAGMSQSQLSLRENSAQYPGLVVGNITIEANLSEYEKRFVIAREIGRSVLRSTSVVGPIWLSDVAFGPFAYYGDLMDELADEFAYALLLPFDLLKAEKMTYEQANGYNPLSYLDWIQHLENRAMIVQCRAILGYDRFRRRELEKRTGRP